MYIYNSSNNSPIQIAPLHSFRSKCWRMQHCHDS